MSRKPGLITCTIHEYFSLPESETAEVKFIYGKGNDMLTWYNSLEGKHKMTYYDSVWHVKCIN